MAVVPLSRPSSQRQRRSCNGQSGQKWVMVREKPERVGYPYLNFAKGVFGFADKPGDELCFLGIGVSRIRLLCDSLKLGLGHRSRTTNKSRDDRRTDRLRPPLDQIIDLGHPLSRLAQGRLRGDVTEVPCHLPVTSRSDAPSMPATSRLEALQPACPLGRVDRQGQGPAALRLRMQASIANPVNKPNGGQFVLHDRALHGKPDHSQTLGPVNGEMQKLTGAASATLDPFGLKSLECRP